MASIEELRADLGELCMLCNQARRPRVKSALNDIITKLEADIHQLKEKALEEAGPADGSGDSQQTKPAVTMTTRKITTYGWDQSEKFAKIYVTANGVHSLDKAQVTSQYGDRSVTLVIRCLDGANHKLEITNLHDSILPADSYHKVKTDTVLVMMKKASQGKVWPSLVRKIDAKPDVKKPDLMGPDDDPSAGLMSMMKKMYDEGDDEMKRSINKAWSQSREKGQGQGKFDMDEPLM